MRQQRPDCRQAGSYPLVRTIRCTPKCPIVFFRRPSLFPAGPSHLYVLPYSFRKKPVLCQGASRIALRLIHLLWVRPVQSSRDIVPLVNQHPAVILHLIGVWRPRTEAHQNNALGFSQAKVHAALKVDTDCGTHLHVGNDIAGLESTRQSPYSIYPLLGNHSSLDAG